MENKTDTRGTRFDFNMIKSSLNSSMEQDNISVSDDLINETMNRIKSQNNLDPSITSNKYRWKSKLNFTNVAAAIIVVFLIGTVVGKNFIDYKSLDLAKGDQDNSYEFGETLTADDVAMDSADSDTLVAVEDSEENQGDLVNETRAGAGTGAGIDGKEAKGYTEDNGSATKDEAAEESVLTFTTITNLDASTVESLEVSYYVDNSVINKDLSLKKEEVFTLFNAYPLDEISANPEEEWTHKLNIVPTGKSIYTIIIGNNIDIIKEAKISNNSNLDEPKDQVRKTFQVLDVEGLKIQLEQLINDK